MKGFVQRRGQTFSYWIDGPPDSLTGKRRQVTKGGFVTEKDAWRACREAITAAEAGHLVRPSRRRIGEFLVDEWLPAVRHVLKPSTYASYEDYTRGYVVPVIGAVRLQHDLTARRLNAFYEHLLTRGRVKRDGGLSPKTVRNVHVMLHKALADAVSWRYVAENVAEHAKPPRAGRRQASVWSPEQVRRFLERTRDDRFYALYLLAATTGMRRAELCGLRWSDVDFGNSSVSIAATRVVVRGYAESSDGKTANSRRLLAVDPVTLAALQVQREGQERERSFFGPDYLGDDHVFTWENGRAVHPDVIRQRFNRQVAALGLPRIRLHDLRHSYATAALAAGVSPKIVSERLGHASVAFTLSQYTHLLPGLDRDAASTVAAILLGPTPPPGTPGGGGPDAVR